MDLTADSFTRACRHGGALIETWLRRVEREHGARFQREAATALRCWQAAEDVVQEAMVKAWQRCATFRGAGDPVAWIHQIVRHTLLDALRRHTPEVPLQDETGELSESAARAVQALALRAEDRPEDLLAEREREAMFARGFARFEQAHPEHAQVLRWVVDDGLSNAELESLLGRSAGATREFVSQARKKARPFLGEWYALLDRA